MADDDMRANAAAGLDLGSAMVRAESQHLDATLQALVQRLSAVPGLKLAVSYRHRKLRKLIGDLPYVNDLHRRGEPVHRIVVAIGSSSYWLTSSDGSIRCGRDTSSTDCAAPTEELSFSPWATMLFEEIARLNFVNHESLVALRHLVEQDRLS